MERDEESTRGLLSGPSLYRSSEEAYQEDVAPRARGLAGPSGSSGRTIGDLIMSGGGGGMSFDLPPNSIGARLMGDSQEAPASRTAQPPSGDFSRGLDVSRKQLKQTAYGTAALIGDTIGSDSLKKWGLEGYKAAEKEVQAISKPSDSFTTALTKEGSLVDWFQYSTGYLLGQVAEMGAAAIAGGIVGSAIGGAATGPAAPVGAAVGGVGGAAAGVLEKAAVQTGIKKYVSKMIDKEAAALTATFIERGMVKEAAEKAAAEKAMSTVYRNIGMTAANTFLNATQELGSIYGEAVEEAAKNGQEYSLGKVWLSGIMATAVDTWADSRAIKGLMNSVKGRSRVGSIALEGFKGGFREGMTEGVQTVIERWGANKDLTSQEAFKEYIDSAAVGVLGGTISGSVSGTVGKLRGNDEDNTDQTKPNFTKLPDPQNSRTRPLEEKDTPSMPREEFMQTLSNPGFVAALYQQATDIDKKLIRSAVERAGFQQAFTNALSDPDQLAYGAKMIQGTPDFVPTFMSAVEDFATTQPRGNVFKVDRRGEGPVSNPTPEEEFEQLASNEGFTLTERPGGPAPAASPRPQRPEPVQPSSETNTVTDEEEQRAPIKNRDELIAKFNGVGNEIFEGEMTPPKEARYDWAMKQLINAGFKPAEARSILTGQTTPAVAEQSAPNLDEQGALDEAVDQGEADVTQDPLYKEFAELHVATSKAEKQSDPSDWTPAMKAADKAGDWREFSRLRGYTDQEIEQFGRYLEVSNQLVDKYGADAVQSEAVALDEENGAVDVEGAAQAADDAALPKDIRGVKMTEKNRPLLDAYFTDEIAALQKKKDGKGKTERLAQLERQALRVGFSQADVDQMFGRTAEETGGVRLKDLEDEPGFEDGKGSDWTPGDEVDGDSQKVSKRAADISQKEADDRFEFVRNERPRVLQQIADLKPGDVVVTEDGRRLTVAERLRDLRDQDGSMGRVAGFAFDTEDEKGYEFLTDKTLADLLLPSPLYVGRRGYVLDKPATIERAPAASPAVETAKSRRLLHFTLPERAVSIRKSGKYTFDNDPVHGTGYTGGPKTGRMAGKRIYLSLDDNIWSKKNGAPLDSVEVDVAPSARILVIDSIGSLRGALREIGGYTQQDLPAGAESFWNNAAAKYDAVEIRVSKRLRETNDFFRTALGSQLVVLNPDVVKISQPDAKPATKTDSQQATDNLKDALANLVDVLTDATGSKMNITGQRYTMADVPAALTKVMAALIKAGYTEFKVAAAEVLSRMRANKDWAPLAGKVDQGMLLKAWNAAGGGKSGSLTGVRLTGSSPYLAKDQRKADKANKFIGRGSERSSTAQYARDFGALANTGSYDASDVVFVSAEGARGGRVEPDFAEIKDAVTAGATILTDDASNRSRPYNVGERQVVDFLSSNGYTESEPGVWRPAKKTDAKPAQPIQKAPEGPAATLRSQTRAVKTGKGDQLITNQNPVNARQFYMSPEEVAENRRRAEEEKSGEREVSRGERVEEADDLDGVTMVEEKAGGKRNPVSSYYRQALRDAKALLSGRVASISLEPGGPANPVRLNETILDRMGFDIFDVKLLDDSSGAGARKLVAIRDEMNRNVAAIKKREKAKPAAPKSVAAEEGVEKSQEPAQADAVQRPAKSRQQSRMDALRDRISQMFRYRGNASYFVSVIRDLEKKLAEIDELLSESGSLTTEDGKKFVAKRGTTDSRPGEFGYQDENAYDRFLDGQVFDKSSPKNELMDIRRRLIEDLNQARQGSRDGLARMYTLGQRALRRHIRNIAHHEVRRGMPPGDVEAVVNEYMAALDVVAGKDKQQSAPESVNAELEEANRRIVEEANGPRVAMSLLRDYKTGRITARELENLEARGLSEGDFSFTDLMNAYNEMGISPQQRLYAGMKHFSSRISLKEYVAQNGGRASAVDAYFLDMKQARALMSEGSFNAVHGPDERAKLALWERGRMEVLGRRRVTEEMRASDNPRRAFSGFLFTRISLEQARNPSLIKNATLRQTYTSLFDNLEEAWFSDVAAALRRRPDLAGAMFEPQYSTPERAAVASDPVISQQDREAFQRWVANKKAAVLKEAEVAAKSPYFTALRSDPMLDAVTTAEGFPMVASTPRYDEVVTLTGPAESVGPQTLMDEAIQAIESFAALQGIKVSDIKRIDGGGRPQDGRGFSRYTFTLKDGRKLVGEQLDLFPGGELSASTEYGIAVPEVMNAALRNDIKAVYKLFEKSDPRTRARTRSQTFYLSAEPDLFLEGSAGRPDNSPKRYEQLYIKVMAGEFEAVQAALDASARLRAVRVGSVDLETGEIVTQQMYDELAADAMDSILMNAEMGSSIDKSGNERTQFGSGIQGDSKVARTVEEAAARDAQIGEQTSAAMEDLSREEQIQEGAISEFDGEVQEGLDENSEAEAEEGRGADEGPAVEQEAESKKGGRVPKSLVPGMEYRFRRGPAWDAFSMVAVQDMVNRLTAGWKNATNVIVLPNAQHLPEPLRSRVIEKLAGSGAKGLYHEGTVYLFSQHLSSEADVEFTLFHEAYGHLGMRAVLGEKFDQFLETAYRTLPEVREAADALIADGMPKLEAIDEVLSDMAAAGRNVSAVKQWVGKIIAGLREIGLTRVADWFASMTDAEVAYVLSSARDAARNGGTPALNGAPSEVRFKEVKPPYEVFAVKDGKTRGYARYNPVTDTWAVFTADGDNIKDGYTTTTTQSLDEVVEAMKRRGKVEYRLRSGRYIDDKIVSDLVEMPKFNDTKKYPIWDPRRWPQLKRTALIQFQNEYLPVFEVIDFLEANGRLTPDIDVKTALTLYERRTGYLIEFFRKKYAEPIMKLVEQAGKLGVTKKDIDRYLTARHAFERNAVIAAINPEMPDGGSGLTNEQAQQILDSVNASPAAQILAEIGRKTDEMSQGKVNYLSQTGMITKSLAKKLSQYQHYVNLSGEAGVDPDMDDPGLLAGGSKFNVKGKERRALGRGEGNEATDVLSRTLQSFEAAIIRGQKNVVAQKVLALIETNYSPEFAIVNAQSRKRQFNPETGVVEEVIDENYMARKDVMVAKIDGIPTTIEFKERGPGSFADAIHGMVSPGEPGPIIAAFGKINRFLGALLTTYNPIFTLVNGFRDAQTMYLQAAADGRIAPRMAREMVKALPSALAAAFREATGYRFSSGKPTDMDKLVAEMKAQGGITYFADRKSLEDQVRKLDNLLSGKKYPMQDAFKVISSLLEGMADVSEMAPRLAAYKVMRENGYSKEQSAVFSGDITVNFNMRGANKEMRQLFLFFNPAVQGSYKIWKLAKTKEGQGRFAKTALALTAFGFLTSLFARAVGGEDDDGIDKLDKVPVYKRATSVVLAPDKPGLAPLPIPYGWNAFFSVGVFMADTFAGKQPMSVTAGRVLKTTAEAFSPIGMGSSDAKTMESFLAKTLAPTALLPLVEYGFNENKFGAPIYEGESLFGARKTPDAQRYFRGVSPISKAITDSLTEITDGSKFRAGKIDVNPATIDFLIQSYTPGIVSEAYKGAGAAIKAAQGETIKHTPWPLLDRFSARIPVGYDAGAYRRAAENVETVYQEYSKTRDQGRRQEIRQEYPRLGYAHAVIASTTQELRQVRRQLDELETRPMSSEERVRRKNMLMDREEVIFKRATKKLMQAGEPVREAMLSNE